MADQAFQYIKLPDGSYGKFDTAATDDVIRSAVMKDFPDAFSGSGGNSRTLTPPSVMNKRTPPGSEHMQNQYLFGSDSPEPIMPQDIIAGTAKDAYTMTRAGYQNAAKGIATGLLHRKSAPLGEPPSQDEFLNAARNIGTGMVMGGIEGEGMTPAASRLTRTADSAPPPTPESFAPRVPPIRGRSSPAGAGGGGAEFASDVMNVIKPKGLKVLELGRKWGNRWLGKGEAGAEAEPEAAVEPPMPHDRAGKGIYGTPVDMWGKTEPTPVPRSPVARPEPAWKRLTKGESNSGGAGPETGGDAVISNPFDSPKYQNSSRVLTRGNQGGANYSADDLIAFKKKNGITDIPAETPSHQPGETATSTAAEVKRLDKDGGQLGQPPATAKLQKFPMTGVKAVGEINPHPRKYYPENPESVEPQVNALSKLKKKGNSNNLPRSVGAAARQYPDSKFQLTNFYDKHPDDDIMMEFAPPNPSDEFEMSQLKRNARLHNVDVAPRELSGLDESQDPKLARKYANAMDAGDQFPSVEVARTSSGNAAIWDGHHRATAAGMLKRPVSANITYTGDGFKLGRDDVLDDYGVKQDIEGKLRKKGRGIAAANDESNPLSEEEALDKVQRAERSGAVGGGENVEKLKWRLMKSMKIIGDSDYSVGVEPYNKFIKATGFDHLQDEGAWFHRNADDAQFEKFTQLVNGIEDPSDVSMVVKQLRQIRGATTRLRKK